VSAQLVKTCMQCLWSMSDFDRLKCRIPYDFIFKARIHDYVVFSTHMPHSVTLLPMKFFFTYAHPL